MFSLFNRMICGIMNRFKVSKRALAVMALMAVAAGGIGAAPIGWDGNNVKTGNWEDGTQWNGGKAPGIAANPTLKEASIKGPASGANIVITLKEDTNLTSLLAYGTVKVIINLNGYNLNTNTLTTAYTSFHSQLEFTGTGTVNVTTFDASTNAGGGKNTLTIGPDVKVNVTTWKAGSGQLTEINGSGSIEITSTDDSTKVKPGASSNASVKIAGVEQNAAIPSTVIWNGSASNNWADPANWDGITDIAQLTNAATVTIPSTARNPIAAADTPVTLNGELIIADDVTVIFSAATTLTDVTSPGGFITTGTDSLTLNGTANLKQITLGNGGTLTSKGNLTAETISGGVASKLFFNAGTGSQTTTLTTLAFTPDTFSFGNNTGDVFNMGAGGTSALNISGVTNATLAGTINSSNLTLNGSPSLAADITLPQVTLVSDTTIDGGSTYKVTFAGDVITDGTEHDLTVNAKGITQNLNTSLGTALNKLKNISLNSSTGTHYEGNNPSSINCTESLSVTDAWFRGKINAGTITASNGAQFLGGTTTVTTTGNQTYSGDVVVNENVTLLAPSDATITFNTIHSHASYFAKDLTIGSSTQTPKVIFNGTVGNSQPFNSITIYGDTEIKRDINSSGTQTYNGNVTLAGSISGSSNTFNNLTITGTGTSRISGDNTVKGDFTCTQPGKTLSFEDGKTLTVNGDFTVTGNAASKITLNSQTEGTQWTLTTSADDADVKYAIVKDSKSTNASIRTKYSTNSGNNTNWTFAAAYRWTGSTSTAWETASNWQVETEPDTWSSTVNYPGENDSEDSAYISTATGTRWPVYSDTSALSLKLISIDTDAKLSVNTTNNIILSDSSSPLTNNGTIVFQNTGRFIDTAVPTANYLMDAAHGTVEFAAGASNIENINPADDDVADYNNVIVSGAVKLAGNIKTKGSVTVSQALDGNSKDLFIGTKLTTTASITDVSTLTVTGAASLGADITTSNAQNYKGATELTDSITLNANGKAVDFAGTVKSKTGSTYDLTVTDTATFHNAVSNIKDLTVGLLVIQSAPAAGTNAIDITGNLTSNNTAGTAFIRGNVRAATVEIKSPLTVGKDTRSITTTGTQKYNDTVSINSEALDKTFSLIAGTGATPSDITFTKTIDAYKNGAAAPTKTAVLIIGSASIKSNVKFEESVGATYRLNSIEVYGTAEFETGKSFSTLTSQTYYGQTKLPAIISFYSKDTAAGTVIFTGDVINASATPSAVTIEEGNVTFGNAGTSASNLGAVKAKGTLTTTASKNIYAASLSVTGTTTNAGIINTTGLQEYTSAVTNTGTINVPSITSGTAVEFKGGFSGTGYLIGAKTSGSDLTPDPDIVFSGGTVTLNGNFSQNDDNVKFAPAAACSFNSNSVELSKVEFAGTGTTTLTSELTCDNLTLSSGTLASATNDITVKSDWSHSGGTFTSSSTVTVKGNVSGTNSFNNLVLNGNLSGNHTSITSLTIEGTGASDTTEISGSNTIGTLTCITPSKKINFTGATTQTVTKLNINGQAGSTPVILNSSDDSSKWNITLTDDANSTVLYSHIKNSTSDNGGTKTVHTHLSKNLGGNTRWIFAENYTWTGADTTDKTNWDNYKNWKITVSGTDYPAVTFPGESSDDDIVTIANVTNKPLFSSASRTIDSLTVNAGSSLTFNSANDLKIKKSTAGLTNNGSIIYSSSGRVKNNAATPAVIMDGAHGKTVFNSGSGTVDAATTGVTGKNYYDLEINAPVSLAAAGITAARDFSLSTAGSITAGGNFTVDGKSSIGGDITTSGNQKYTGQTTLNAATLTFASPSKTITFTGDVINGTGITSSVTISSGDVTFGNTGTSASKLGSISAGGKFTTTASKNIYAATLSVTGTTTNAGIINTTGLQEYTGAVTNTGTINVPSIASGTAVEFKGGISGAGSLIGAKTSGSDLTPDPDIVFSGGTASFGTFTPNNDTVVFKNNVTLGSAFTCYDLVIDTGATLSAGANLITVNRNWNNKGTFAAGTSTITVAKNIDGTTTFNKLIINNASDTTVISDDNTIKILTCETPSKVIVINKGKTQTITSSLTLDGKASGTEITLKSDSATATAASDQWNIDTTGAVTDIKYVKVQNSNSTKLITTSVSVSMGNNINWAIASDFKWTGNGGDTDWETPANWVTVYSSTEYLTNDYPGKWGESSIFDTADISTTLVAGKWPVFSETVNSLKLEKISIGTNGSLTLTGTKDLQLNDSTTPVSNAGKIIYSSKGRLKNNAATPVPVMDITKGLVIYNGSADTITNINTRGAETTEPSDYFNLKVEIDIPAGGCITVANNFTLDDGKNISTNTDGYRFIVRKEASLGGSITTTDLQKYQGKVTLTQDVTLKAKNSITFESDATIDGESYNLILDNDSAHQANYELKKDVTVKSLTVNIASGKKLSVPSPVVITAKDGFTVNGAGTVSLGTESQVTETKIVTEKKDINFSGTGTVTVNSPVTLDTTSGAAAGSGNITIVNPFQGKTADSQPLTITAGTGNVNLKADMGTTVSLGAVTITDNDTTLSQSKELKAKSVSITGAKITAEESSKITASNNVTLTNSGLFLTEKGTVITALTGFTKTGAGLSQIAGTIRTNNSAISLNTTTYIYNASTFDTSNNGAVASPTTNITIGTGTADDLYISALEGTTAQNVTVKAGTLDVKGNIVLFNGKVTLNAGMKSGSDIVLLNGDTSNMNDIMGTAGVISYLNPLRKPANNLCAPSLSAYPPALPDTTVIVHNRKYISSLSGFEGKTISAGKNFYDNGVNLNATAEWTLNIPDNDSARNSFAELHNASISYCKVTSSGTFAWLSAAEGCTDGGNNTFTDTVDSIDYGADDGRGRYSRVNYGIAFLRPVILRDTDDSKSASEGRTTGPEVPNLSGTYSVRDNVIRIEFVRSNFTNGIVTSTTNQKDATALIENTNNEISKAVSLIKYDDGKSVFEGTFIDAECTTSTDGKGDIAVFYIKAPDSQRWNLQATGISIGTDNDTTGTHNARYNDIEMHTIVSGVFATLYDQHKNRVADYSGTSPRPTASSAPGFRFTATTSRCAIDQMHIIFSVADFTSNKIYLYFDQPLSEDITWNTYNPGTPVKTEESIKILDAGKNPTSYRVSSVDRDTLNDHGLILVLNNDLDYTKINYGIKIEYGGSFLFNNKIHSPRRRVVNDGESHCISDVLVNAIDVQYAYDNRNDAYIDYTGDATLEAPIATRDFAAATIHNKVFADKNITLVAKDISGNVNGAGESLFRYKLIADITPSAHSEGEVFTACSGIKTRFWFPLQASNIVSGYSSSLNTSSNIEDSNGTKIDVTPDPETGTFTYLFHNFSEETPCLNWKSVSDVRFMFEVLKSDGTPYEISHKFNDSEKTPLYAVRLQNPAELTSIDLWSFIIAEPYRQRGGVSIYSNVVNATNKEYCTLEVNMPRDGSLRVMVMTADGNIVTYLENGRQTEGLHYYYWNGTNNSGKAVARGIYFIRVVGPEIEETRKVMVVK
mgnify:CR=1 FL=1